MSSRVLVEKVSPKSVRKAKVQRTGNVCLVLGQVEVITNILDDGCCCIGTAASIILSVAGEIDSGTGQAAADPHLMKTVKKAIQLR